MVKWVNPTRNPSDETVSLILQAEPFGRMPNACGRPHAADQKRRTWPIDHFHCLRPICGRTQTKWLRWKKVVAAKEWYRTDNPHAFSILNRIFDNSPDSHFKRSGVPLQVKTCLCAVFQSLIECAAPDVLKPPPYKHCLTIEFWWCYGSPISPIPILTW